MLATEIAEQLQESQQEETGEDDVPIEERHDSPPVARADPVTLSAVDVSGTRTSNR